MEQVKTKWKRMQFKTNKVWLMVDSKDNPVVNNDKVLIKYQLKQDYEYWVHLKNVKPIDPATLKKKSSKKRSCGKKRKDIKKDVKEIEKENHTGNICVWTDGASSGNPGPSGIGAFFKFNGREKELSRYIGMATNNIAELEAIRASLLELKTFDLPVRIFTDSKYAYGVLSLGWRARKNVELIESIKEIMEKFKDLKFIKVKGHDGLLENEKADDLATIAVKNRA